MSKKNTVPFNRFSFTNTSTRYISSPASCSSSDEKIVGPYGSGVPAIVKRDGKNLIQIYPEVYEDIDNVNMIQDYTASVWTTLESTITINSINSPIGTLTADLCTATGVSETNHGVTTSYRVMDYPGTYNIHGGFFKKGTKGKSIALGATVPSYAIYVVGFDLITGYAADIGEETALVRPYSYGSVQLNDGWWFFWMCYEVNVDPEYLGDPEFLRVHYISDDSGNFLYTQSGENYYYWGGTDELAVVDLV